MAISETSPGVPITTIRFLKYIPLQDTLPMRSSEKQNKKQIFFEYNFLCLLLNAHFAIDCIMLLNPHFLPLS